MKRLLWLRRDIQDIDTASPGSYWFVYEDDHPLSLPIAMIRDTKEACIATLKRLASNYAR